jgi:hypothetical protein
MDIIASNDDDENLQEIYISTFLKRRVFVRPLKTRKRIHSGKRSLLDR